MFFFPVGEDERKLTSRSAQKHALSSEGYWKMMGSLSQSQTLKSGDERDGQSVYLLGYYHIAQPIVYLWP